MLTLLLPLMLAAQATQPPASQQAAAAYAEGERLLEAADARDLFVNESASAEGAIILRHKASGYRCVLNPGKAENAVRLFPGSPRGDDVGCTTQTITDNRTLYLTRTTGTVAQEAQAAAAAIRTRYQGAREADLSGNRGMFALPADQVPEHVTMGFNTRGGYEQATVGVANGWAVKYRFSLDAGHSGMSGILEGFWITTMLEPQLAARRAARAAELQQQGQAPATPDASAPAGN